MKSAEPETFREILEWLSKAHNRGIQVFGQVAPRPVGVLVGLGTSRNPFQQSTLFSRIESLAPAERLRRLNDPAVREVIVSELDQEAESALGRVSELGDPPDYFPDPEVCLAKRAARMGMTSRELAYDLVRERGGRNILFLPVHNSGPDSMQAVETMLGNEFTLLGLSDGGAHYSRTSDASFPTFLITQWAQGDRFRLEEVVKWQTSDAARFLGLKDRGVILPGMRADLNLIDIENLKLDPPQLIADLPGGGARMLQSAKGYERTFLAGVCTQSQGRPTGQLPGRLIRHNHANNN